jgi:hypothetical protein
MLVYPIPTAVTQARVQLVADQTEKAPPQVIQADVLNIADVKNEAERQALAEYREAQAKDDHVDKKA